MTACACATCPDDAHVHGEGMCLPCAMLCVPVVTYYEAAYVGQTAWLAHRASRSFVTLLNWSRHRRRVRRADRLLAECAHLDFMFALRSADD